MKTGDGGHLPWSILQYLAALRFPAYPQINIVLALFGVRIE